MTWTSDDAAAVLTAGGLFPVGKAFEKDTPADDVLARTYANPGLGARPVVQLVAKTMAPAEDRSLEFLGFSVSDAGEPVATGYRAGLGFPAWVLVHDPKRAKVALAVVKDMERAARVAKSRPGHAIDLFGEIAGRLPVEHQPSFWEQAGRAFIVSGNNQQAATMFGKAREVEQVYALPVDEAARRETFLEFAFAGALTVKSIANYVTELSARYEPSDAYDALVALGLRRTLGGLPPWTDMPKQVRKLAKAAGLDVAAEEQRILGLLLSAPATALAPMGFWKSWRASVISAAKASPELRGRLLNLNPTPSSYDNAFAAPWLQLLDEAGALDALVQPAGVVAPETGPDGGAAAWLAREVVRSFGGYRSTGFPPELFALVERMADRLRADGTPVTLIAQWGNMLDAELLDLCLALDVPVADPRQGHRLALDPWLLRGCQRSLDALVADDRFSPLLSIAIRDHCLQGRNIDQLASVPALAPLVERWLSEEIGGLAGGVLIGATQALTRLAGAVGPRTFSLFPDLREAMAGADLAESLATTLRTGILDELGWPALEDAIDELAGDPSEIQHSCSFPVLVLFNSVRAIAVGPDNRLVEHDLRLVNAANWARPMVLFAEGQLMVTWQDAEYTQRAYWSGDPGDVFEPANASAWTWNHGDANGYTPLLADGSRLSGGRALHAGDHALPAANVPILTDGTTFWTMEWDAGSLTTRELDPHTGQKGRLSAPAFFEDAPRGDRTTLQHWLSSLNVLPDGVPNPSGAKDGLVGYRVLLDAAGERTIEAYDGTSLSMPTTAEEGAGGCGLVSLPGRAEPVAFTSDSTMLVDREQGVFAAIERGSVKRHSSFGVWHRGPPTMNASGTAFGVPPAYWPCMRVRDEPGSLALRGVTTAQARALLDAVTDELAATDSNRQAEDLVASAEAVRQVLPDVSHPRLVLGVVGTARHAAKQQRLRDKVVTRGEPVATEGAAPIATGSLDGHRLHEALSVMSVGSRGRSTDTDYIAHEANYLSGVTNELPAATSGGRLGVHWWHLIGTVGAVAFHAAHPLTSDENRATLTSLLELWATLPIVDDTTNWWAGTVNAVGWANWDVGTNDRGRFLVANEHGTSCFVEVRHGDARVLPDDFKVEDCAPVPPGWGTAAQITEFLEVLRRKGPVEWDPDAPVELARRTGLTAAEATLLWAGFPNFGSYYDHNFLTPELRKRFGLKVAEAKAAKDSLWDLTGRQRRALWASTLGADPEALWSPLDDADGDLSPVHRMAATWIALFGERIALPDDTYPAMKTLGRRADPATLAGLLLTPDGGELTGFEPNTVVQPYQQKNHNVPERIVDAAHLIPWAVSARPAGDALRAAAPGLLESVRATLADAGLVLQASHGHATTTESEIHALFGHEPFRGRPADDTMVDDGLTIADPQSGSLYFRPALLGDDERSAVLQTVIDAGQGLAVDGWTPIRENVPALVRWLKGDRATAMTERVRAGGVADGCYEADPRNSAAAVVDAVASSLDVEPDPAALFLQLLTLLEPTDKHVKLWNGWTPARHKKAIAALLDRGLVVNAKRERAGRSVFLPGGWSPAKAPNPPLETWKLSMYDLRIGTSGRPVGLLDRYLPMRPLPDLFAVAWQRFLDDPPTT